MGKVVGLHGDIYDGDTSLLLPLAVMGNLATLGMIVCGLVFIPNILRGQKVSEFIVLTYLGMMPRCMIHAFYSLSLTIVEGGPHIWNAPVNFIGGVVAFFFVLLCIRKINYYNTKKMAEKLVVLAIFVVLISPLIIFTGSVPISIFLLILTIEILFVLVPLHLLKGMSHQKDLSEFYLPIPVSLLIISFIYMIYGYYFNWVYFVTHVIIVLAPIAMILFYCTMMFYTIPKDRQKQLSQPPYPLNIVNPDDSRPFSDSIAPKPINKPISLEKQEYKYPQYTPYPPPTQYPSHLRHPTPSAAGSVNQVNPHPYSSYSSLSNYPIDEQ
ncbi:hypothetical protein CYY_005340 [Polysphondylium violaceum]|uniref:Transmembrane protein n=1 Tax=Polysphondylium violaceum TaxID=133409 RepID=A0A8J4V6Y1_9MYCE|nr:hypothetical protein CYY_005340 [Polysphondylium violaceum]